MYLVSKWNLTILVNKKSITFDDDCLTLQNLFCLTKTIKDGVRGSSLSPFTDRDFRVTLPCYVSVGFTSLREPLHPPLSSTRTHPLTQKAPEVYRLYVPKLRVLNYPFSALKSTQGRSLVYSIWIRVGVWNTDSDSLFFVTMSSVTLYFRPDYSCSRPCKL